MTAPFDRRRQPRMHARILTFAEHVTISNEAKLTLSGTIDGIVVRRSPGTPPGAVILPQIFLVIVIEGSIANGLAHRLGIRVMDEDARHVTFDRPDALGFNFHLNEFGRPLRAQIVLDLNGFRLNETKDYVFHLLVDGEEFAQLPLYVTDRTPSA